MILISIFWMILLADIVGTVSYVFWKKIIVRFLVPHGEVVMIRISLTIVLLLHLLPVSFLYQAGTGRYIRSKEDRNHVQSDALVFHRAVVDSVYLAGGLFEEELTTI